MQKVIRRSALAEAQAARRLARKKDKYVAAKRKGQREHERHVERDIASDIKTARLARREDWELGPIAPRRDVGLQKETYGTISTMRIQGKELTIKERLAMNPNSGRFPNLVAGDRVVILEGRDKGKIGKLANVDGPRQECTVEGLNMVDIAVPEWMLKADENDQRRVRTMEKPIPLTSVRLVFPLPDPTTGVMRDVIVKKLINGPIFHDRYTGRKRWSRIIPGLDVVVPWPKVEPKVHTDYDCDTLRIDVESITFVPSLLKPPMPPTVIDELRNKFSIFRTRHEESYIAEKIREEQEAQAKKKLAEEMRTPLKEVNRRERKLRKASGKGKLTRDMLVRIGEVVEKKRLAVAEASGLQKEAVAV